MRLKIFRILNVTQFKCHWFLRKKKYLWICQKAFQALGHATAQMVSCQSLTTEAWVQSQASPVHMGFMVNIVELEQVFLQLLWFTPISIILSVFHTHILFTYL